MLAQPAQLVAQHAFSLQMPLHAPHAVPTITYSPTEAASPLQQVLPLMPIANFSATTQLTQFAFNARAHLLHKHNQTALVAVPTAIPASMPPLAPFVLLVSTSQPPTSHVSMVPLVPVVATMVAATPTSLCQDLLSSA
jgi:hypothetical protein